MSQDDPQAFGTRFAQTWAALQQYLADLDGAELRSLHGEDLAGTLRLLGTQPKLGDQGALTKAARGGPEALAVALVRERLAALEEDFDEPWGGRFLVHWRKLGGPMSSFSYAKIQKLKVADREGVLAILKPNGSTAARGLREVLKHGSPEAAAERLLTEYRMAALTMAMILT